jgi:hypothetical protein
MQYTEAEQEIVRQRIAAGPALAEIRRQELRELTDEQALQIAENLLSLFPLAPPKREITGLVEQQRLFARLRA